MKPLTSLKSAEELDNRYFLVSCEIAYSITIRASNMFFSVTTFNRSKVAIPSLKQLISIIDGRHQLFIHDDGSTDYDMTNFLQNFQLLVENEWIRVNVNEHKGVDQNNISRLDMILDNQNSFVYLTDDDIQYSNLFYTELQKMKEMMEKNSDILAGTLFNVNGNKLGRHRLRNPERIYSFKDTNYYQKDSFGGCSVLIKIVDFIAAMTQYSHPDYHGPYGWDWSICNYAIEQQRVLVASENSYVQHIGTIGMNSRPYAYDSADNFIND